MPRFTKSALLKMKSIIGLCALVFVSACSIWDWYILPDHNKFYFMTDNETFVTYCSETPNDDPSAVLAKLENDGMNCTKSPRCPTCGCNVYEHGRFCSCQNSVEWSIEFFEVEGLCTSTRRSVHWAISEAEEKEKKKNEN